MYEAFFQLHSRPFAPIPQPQQYFPAATIENARQSLERLVERGEGPGLVIGPPGTGKTLLCTVLAERFRESFAVALLTGGRLKTCRALLQAVHYELGLPFRGLDEGELRLSLVDFLEPSDEGPRGLLLLVDEAHTLPYRLLDEIRLITNLIRDGQPRVRVILAGGPLLEERFASPKLTSFSQRLAARCYLEALDRGETASYVRAQIQAAGGDPAELLDEATLQNVYRATDGIPRLINQVCDHALVLAAVGGQPRLSSDAIDEAWSDLQQLPTPWSGDIRVQGDCDVVEFGSLGDEDESREAIPFPSPQQPQACESLHVREIEDSDELEPDAAEETNAELTSEVELHFPEFGDPFDEQFDEEELVVNNYVTDAEFFAGAPRVSSWEGRQLGSLLPATPEITWSSNRSEPQRDVESTGVKFVADSAAEPMELPHEEAETLELDFEPGEEVPLEAVGREEVAESSAIEIEPQEPAPHAVPGVVAGERPPIVVEESPPAPTVPLKRPRSSEFRQLFSKLRRG